MVKVFTFNILSDALGDDEFICQDGNSDKLKASRWENREDKLVDIMIDILNECDVLVTQENDHFFRLFDRINLKVSIGGVYSVNTKTIKINQKTDRTYNDESPSYGTLYANFYGKCSHDQYFSSHGIGVYYRLDKLKHISSKSIKSCICNTEDELIIFDENLLIINSGDYCVVSSFLDNNNVNLTIVGAHLKSGELYECELKRIEQLQNIFNSVKQSQNVVIAMDSNCSNGYIEEYDEHRNNIIKVITANNYVDTLDGTTGNECLKIRHGFGDQPSKFYRVMFDRIDRILVKVNTNFRELERVYKGYSKDNYGTLNDIRKNKRKQVYEHCVNMNTKDSDVMFSECFTELKEVYPNHCFPSDHPPCGVEVFI